MPIARLWQIAAVLVPIILTAGSPAFTIDTWWDLTMGRLMVEARRPLVDAVLSFGPAAPGSVHGQWLSHVLMYTSYALAGDLGVRLFVGGIASLAFGLVMLTGRLLGGGTRTAALGALLAAFIAANNLGLRAQVFSYLLLATVALLLALRHRHPRSLLALPLVFMAWANLHGAFLMGLALVGLHAADAFLDALAATVRGERAAWRATAGPLMLLALLAASAVAATLNPLGFGVYTYVWSIASYASNKTLIPEWQPTTIQDFGGQALAAASLLLAVLLRKSERPISRLEILTLVGFGLVALTSQRQVAWWGLLAGPILARHAAALPRPEWLEALPPPSSPTPTLPNWLLAGLLTAIALGSPFWRPALASQIEGGASSALSTPTGVVQAAATLPEGARMFVFQPWTGYVAWTLWPHQQSWLDARFETHPTSVWDEYQAVSAGRADWEQIVERYEIDYLVLDATQQRFLAELALRSGRWLPSYRDHLGIILERASVAHPS